MTDYKKEMGLRIKARRRKMFITQEFVAEHLGVSVKHFSEVERGIAGLSIENLIKLSDLLGLSLDFIIKGEAKKDEWDSILSLLNTVPKDKEETIKEIIRLAVNLSN
ncbi:MAG: helix-turn-helix transcriptional regulator [Clostridia bacterium]|nr:helix-turn-helix transcriptional regulator [Clostridia bacterium]